MSVADKVTAAFTGKTEDEVKDAKEKKALEDKAAAEAKQLEETVAKENAEKEAADKKAAEEKAKSDKAAAEDGDKMVRGKGLAVTSRRPKGFIAAGLNFAQTKKRYVTKAHIVARWSGSLAEGTEKKEANDFYNRKWAEIVAGGEKEHLAVTEVKEIPADQVCKDGDVLTS